MASQNFPRPGRRLATNSSLSDHLVAERPHQHRTGFLHDSNNKTWFTQFSPKTTFHATHYIRIVLVPKNHFLNKALHFRKYVGCFECKLFGFSFPKSKPNPSASFITGLNRPVTIFKHVFKVKARPHNSRVLNHLEYQKHHTKHLVNIFINTKIFFIGFSKTKPYNTNPFRLKVQKQCFFSKPFNLTS
ncbi:hypothetical protein QL285_026536 [Trifolium repens]|nr:hypothetical protein QL285_026536 [Trifolium repens]